MITYLLTGVLSLLPVVLPEVVQYDNLIPDCRVVVDYGVAGNQKPETFVIYALPNGNSIEWTAGKKMQPGDDWHYDIQHIKAQTEFLRNADTSRHYIVAYLEASMKAWTAHAARYGGTVTDQNPKGLYSCALYPELVDTLIQMAGERMGSNPAEVVLASHSGGGRFVLNYVAGVDRIPQEVTRLAFLDSNYGFEDSLHTAKLTDWLKNSPEHKLAVFAYVDTTVVLNGKRIVSATGGTGYKTEEMYRSLANTGAFVFQKQADTCLQEMRSGNILLLKKENPQGEIYHTVLVERNGLIHSLLFATPLEEKGYRFWRNGREYESFIPDKPLRAVTNP